MPAVRNNKAVSSLAGTTKELTTFLAAATFAHAVQDVFVPTGATKARALADVPVLTWVVFGLLVISALRFFYGNIRYIDCAFVAEPSGDASTGTVVRRGIDLLVLTLESVLLVAASFFINDAKRFFYILLALLAFELLWFVIILASGDVDFTQAKRQRWAELNNLLGIAGLVIVLVTTRHAGEAVVAWTGAAVVVVTFFLDAFINADFYFS